MLLLWKKKLKYQLIYKKEPPDNILIYEWYIVKIYYSFKKISKINNMNKEKII